jgi:LPXTG-motif cell wall-anchored protein
MDKDTELPLLIDGETVTEIVRFIADVEAGYIDVEFHLDASGLEGRTIVIFERLYRQVAIMSPFQMFSSTENITPTNYVWEHMASDEDINNENQTIRFYQGITTGPEQVEPEDTVVNRPAPPNTGVNNTIILYGIVALVAGSALFYLKKKSNN